MSRDNRRDDSQLEAWRRAPNPVDLPMPSPIERLLEAIATENPRQRGEGAGSYIRRLRALAGLPDTAA